MLSANDGLRQLRRRAGSVSVRSRAQAGQCGSYGSSGGRAAAAATDGAWMFPGTRIRVRLDGGFASPTLFEFLESEPKVEYVVAMTSNAVLKWSPLNGAQVFRGRCFV